MDRQLTHFTASSMRFHIRSKGLKHLLLELAGPGQISLRVQRSGQDRMR